jgi:hypothetical protein
MESCRLAGKEDEESFQNRKIYAGQQAAGGAK